MKALKYIGIAWGLIAVTDAFCMTPFSTAERMWKVSSSGGTIPGTSGLSQGKR